MKRILLACLVLLGIEAVGQPTNYTWYKQRTRQYSMMLDSALFVPTYNGTPSGYRVGENSARDGAVAIDTANSRFYIYSGGAWVRVANYTDIASTATLRSVLIADQRSLIGNKFFVGDSAGYLIPHKIGSDSSNTVAIGDHAGYGNDGAIGSFYAGYYAGYNAFDSYFTNAIGWEAGRGTENASYSNFLGWRAGKGATNADNVNYLGALAGFEAVSGNFSNFIGDEAGYQATNASNSNFQLYQAGYQATNASTSNFLGRHSGYQATNASGSNFIGYESGYQATGATTSNFIGTGAGHRAKNATYSNLIGFQAGMSFSADTIGSNNIIIGTNISLPDDEANRINIGGVIFGSNTYSTTTGNPRVTAVTNPQVSIGTNSPAASAILDLTSTSKGFLAPRMTAVQRAAITPATGLIVFDTDTASHFQYNGSAWQNLYSAGGGGGTPGGSNKQFQYNNSSAFAGSAMLTQETDQVLITGTSTAGTTPFVVNGHEDLTNPIAEFKKSATSIFQITATAISPSTSDAGVLGSATKQWSDLFLAEGGVINWDNGDATLTQTGNVLALAGAALTMSDFPTISAATADYVPYFSTAGLMANSGDFRFNSALRAISAGATSGDGQIRSYQDASNYVSLMTNTGTSKSGIFRSNTNFFIYYSTATGNTHLDATFSGSHIDFDIEGTNRMRLSNSRNLLLGGTADPASANAALALFNGTAPSASVSNGIVLYSEDVAASSEFKVRDEAGNITVLSPHHFTRIPEGRSELLAWVHYSERDGEFITADMAKALRTIEEQDKRIISLEERLAKLEGVIYEMRKPVKLIYTGKVSDEEPNPKNK